MDVGGLVCGNDTPLDLHHAAGGLPKHQPGFFMRRKECLALIAEMGTSADSQTPYVTRNDGRNNGTYVAKELVYAYAEQSPHRFEHVVVRPARQFRNLALLMVRAGMANRHGEH